MPELTQEQQVEFKGRAQDVQNKINAILKEAELKMEVVMVPTIKFEDLKYVQPVQADK